MFLLPLALWGCATYTPPDLSKYFWPPAPEKKRVQLLRVIHTDLDVRGSASMDSIFGGIVGFAFKKPHGIAVDNNGNIYVSDTMQNAVFILNLEEKSIEEFRHPRGWGMPGGLAVDVENGLIAAVSGKNVSLFDLETKELKSTIGGFQRPAGLAFDPERKVLYISDARKHTVRSYTYDGKMSSVIAESGGELGKVFAPIGLAVDSSGRLFVVDSMNWRVQIFSPDGTAEKSFGQHGDIAGEFARPKCIAINRDDFVLVTDAAFGNFQIMDTDGRTYLDVGSIGRGFGSFQTPYGIAVDQNDVIYAVDQTNRRIQVFQLLTDRYYAEHPEGAAGSVAPGKKEKGSGGN